VTEPDLFPVFLKLEGRRVLVVGAGPVGASKVAALATTGARITVVAPEVHPDLLRAPVELHRRKFRPSDLDGVWLVVAAAPPEVNRAVDRHARKRQIFVNAADDPQNATAYLGGTLRRDARDDRDLDERPRAGARWSAARRTRRAAAWRSRSLVPACRCAEAALAIRAASR
jgi:2-polyprenyl-6-methoxyphenol hydroxylase-like FAD-dependent oxidoreductase